MGTTQPIREEQALASFKDYYRTKKRNLRNYTMIIMGLNTALRIGDILNLQWRDVYLFDKRQFKSHIEVTEHKTGKRTRIFLNNNIICALTEYRSSKTSGGIGAQDYLFTGQKSPTVPLCRQQAFRIIKKAAAASGLTEHISCHSMRKTFGYHAWKQGTPPALLMDIYNHSSYQITRRYLCIEQDDKDAVFMGISL